MFCENEFSKGFYQLIPDELKNSSFLVSWCEYKGIYYKPGVILTLEVNLDCCLFGEVDKILIRTSKIPFFIVIPFKSVGFDSHFYAHEVIPNNDNSQIGYYINQIPDKTPTIT